MRLIHWDKEIITYDPNRVYPDSERDAYFKPKGLWVSDEDDFGWSHWCDSEQFDGMGRIYEHQVGLWPDHNILVIRDVESLDKFHERFAHDILGTIRPFGINPRKDWLDWRSVYPLWQGIIITPYLWDRRMDYMWYYGWDCASGNIWDLSAIRSFQPLLKALPWNGLPN
jgi:hypothetical protein